MGHNRVNRVIFMVNFMVFVKRGVYVEEPMKHSLNQIVNIVDDKQGFDDLSVTWKALESHSPKVSPCKKVYRIDDKV